MVSGIASISMITTTRWEKKIESKTKESDKRKTVKYEKLLNKPQRDLMKRNEHLCTFDKRNKKRCMTFVTWTQSTKFVCYRKKWNHSHFPLWKMWIFFLELGGGLFFSPFFCFRIFIRRKNDNIFVFSFGFRWYHISSPFTNYYYYLLIDSNSGELYKSSSQII